MIDAFSYRRTWIRYSIEGSGPPLLLCNGIGAPFELLEPLRGAFSNRTTIAWDAPGAGGSGVPVRRPTMRFVADAAAALLDHVGVKEADVLGVSWGGLVAQELALAHPERVRRLVLAATGMGLTSVPGDLRALGSMLNIRRYTSPGYLLRVGPRLYGGDIARDPDLLQQQTFARLRHAPSIVGYWWQASCAAWWSSWRRLPRIARPTLVMAADDDPLANVRNGRIIAGRIPNAVLDIVEGGGHLFLLTRVSACASRIDQFLDGGSGDT